jgi:hypothetical protein
MSAEKEGKGLGGFAKGKTKKRKKREGEEKQEEDRRGDVMG